ncbi:hypothetical protein Bca4012_020105 [Brassica carinata]
MCFHPQGFVRDKACQRQFKLRAEHFQRFFLLLGRVILLFGFGKAQHDPALDRAVGVLSRPSWSSPIFSQCVLGWIHCLISLVVSVGLTTWGLIIYFGLRKRTELSAVSMISSVLITWSLRFPFWLTLHCFSTLLGETDLQCCESLLFTYLLFVARLFSGGGFRACLAFVSSSCVPDEGSTQGSSCADGKWNSIWSNGFPAPRNPRVLSSWPILQTMSSLVLEGKILNSDPEGDHKEEGGGYYRFP